MRARKVKRGCGLGWRPPPVSLSLKSQKVGRSASLGYFEHSASYRLPYSGMGLTHPGNG